MHNLARFVSSHVLYLHMIWSLNYVLQISITYSGFFVHTWRICGQLCEVISLCSLYIEVAPFCIFFWQCSVCIRFFVFSWWCFVWIRWSWRKTPVALCVTESRCFVKRSLESSVRPRYRMEGLQGITVCWNWGMGRGAGLRLVNTIASVLLTFTLSFHLVKYLCSVSMAEVVIGRWCLCAKIVWRWQCRLCIMPVEYWGDVACQKCRWWRELLIVQLLGVVPRACFWVLMTRHSV